MNAWLLGAIVAVAPLDEVHIQTTDGTQVAGVISAIKPHALVVHEGQGTHRLVELTQMDSIEIDGAPMSLEVLQSQIDLYVHERYGTGDAPQPAPGAVVLASAILPGAGHALLGDRETFAAYAIADIVSLGLAGFLIWERQSFSQGLPLLTLDLTFRVYSAAEARKIARLRREIHAKPNHLSDEPEI